MLRFASEFPYTFSAFAFGADQSIMVRNYQRSVHVLVDQAELFIKLHSDPNCVDGKPLAIPLDFRFVKRNNYFSDGPRQSPVRVDRFQAEHLIENDIVCAVLLAHKEVNRFGSHKVDFQLHPVEPLFPFSHSPPS